MANLRTALWRLPEPIREVVDVGADHHLALRAEVVVDVDLLGCPDHSLPDVDEIADEVLSGWYDDWVVAERERLELRRITVLERIASGHLAVGAYATAIDVAMLAIGADPFRESLHRIVLSAHIAEGNGTEALAHYRGLVATLSDEIGALPSDATRDVLGPLALGPLPAWPQGRPA